MSSSGLASFSPASAIENFFRINGDKRVAELRFMNNPWEVLLISVFYVYFSYDLGPYRIMKNREAFDLVWTVRAFNTFILMLNVWLLTKFFSLSNWGYDSLGCSIAPGGSSAMFPIVNGMVHTIMYVYYILSTFESVKPYLWWKNSDAKLWLPKNTFVDWLGDCGHVLHLIHHILQRDLYPNTIKKAAQATSGC